MYGTIDYERSRAIKLAEDIADHGLRQGGEQYPNASCAIDCAESLHRAVKRTPDLPEAESAAYGNLAKVLNRIWTEGYEPYHDRGVARDELVAAADAALTAIPPVFSIR